MARKPVSKPIGHLLMEALTADQVAQLLGAIFPQGERLDRLLENLKRVDADLVATLRSITSEGDPQVADRNARSRRKPITSLQRDVEQWEALWQQWEAHVLEVGDEEGEYASREGHWEPPSFDGYELAYDLDVVAEKMLPLIDRVFEAIDNSDLFLDSLAGISAGIKDYPEWMGAEHDDGCCFQRHATHCILHWSWRACMNADKPGTALVQQVLLIENDYDQVSLDTDATVDFFARLPDETCREVYNLLETGRAVFALDQVHSVWHRIHHEYQGGFDSGRYLETCAAHLSANWRYGRALVEDAVARGDWKAAESWLEKTIMSMLSPRRKSPWFPESDLLFLETKMYVGINAEEIVPLLKLWGRAALERGLDSRSAAAEFQALVFEARENWDAVLAAYSRTIETDSWTVIDPLWEQWKNDTAGRSLRRYLGGTGEDSTWVHWLLDALVEDRSGRQSFHKCLDAWLKTLHSDGTAFEKQWQSLALLTDDLDPEQRLQQRSPRFCQAVMRDGIPGGSRTAPLTIARRAALARMKAESFLPDILDVWKQHLHRIVPDPASTGSSNYTRHASWAAAVQELNPDRFKTLMDQWRKKHNRRRNLWRDLKALGVSV